MQQRDVRNSAAARGAGARGQRGGVSVEYAFCALLAALLMQGVFKLFSAMSLQIVRNFMDWISRPYP